MSQNQRVNEGIVRTPRTPHASTWLSDLAIVAELRPVVAVLDKVGADGARDHDAHVTPVTHACPNEVGVGEGVDAVVVVVVPAAGRTLTQVTTVGLWSENGGADATGSCSRTLRSAATSE